MSKPTHTPGPWKLNSLGQIEGADGYPIIGEHLQARHDGDDLLIAAAPELAETLREVADFWAGGDAPQDLMDKINAALAKAGL